MKKQIKNGITIITANKGKDLQRKADKKNFGKQVYLGYTYYINDKKLDQPHLETPEDYQEIPEVLKDSDNMPKTNKKGDN